MLKNTNVCHLSVDYEFTVEESEILIIEFTSFHFDHALDTQPKLFKTLVGVDENNWTEKFISVHEMPELHYLIPYSLVIQGVPNWDDLQTMWFVYEELRLKLLSDNPDWDSEKLINLVPYNPEKPA